MNENQQGKKSRRRDPQGVEKSSSLKKYEEEWIQLFYVNDVEELRRHAILGSLRASRFRSVCWRVLLDTLPQKPSEWPKSLKDLRQRYDVLKEQLFSNPRLNSNLEDNPLSQNDTSLWNQHFCDEELRAVIKQDVVRTFPGVDFFRKANVQNIMTDVLFVYAREHPRTCYRQGMHELLAPLLFVLHCDQQAMLHTREQMEVDALVETVLSPQFIEQDAYIMFSKIMEQMEWYYHISNVAPTLTGYFPASLSPLSSPTGEHRENVVVNQLNKIRDELLAKIDPDLCKHLKDLDISLPLFGIRWLRLLFGREFPLQDLLVLWDVIFSEGHKFEFVNYVVVAMLEAIRNPLLESDYTNCLTYLMRYPAVVDVMQIVEHALHLKQPDKYSCPKITPLTINKLGKSQGESGNSSPLVNKLKRLTLKKSSHKSSTALARGDADAGIVDGYTLSDPEKLLAELNHAHKVMALCEIKLKQYSATLQKAFVDLQLPDDARHAVDGMQELCYLLKSRYHLQHQPSEVEDAIEAGEIRPNALLLQEQSKTVPAVRQPQPTQTDVHMKTFARSEGHGVEGAPMADPLHHISD